MRPERLSRPTVRSTHAIEYLRQLPAVAVLLAAAVTGLGHLYLRRLRRGAGWLLGLATVAFLFVPPGAFGALVGGGTVDAAGPTGASAAPV